MIAGITRLGVATSHDNVTQGSVEMQRCSSGMKCYMTLPRMHWNLYPLLMLGRISSGDAKSKWS